MSEGAGEGLDSQNLTDSASLSPNPLIECGGSEQEYRTFIQASMDSFWKVGTDGRLLDCNEAACAMLGYTRDELLAMSLHNVDAIEDEAKAAEHMRRIISAGNDRFETQHRCKDGRIIDVEVSAHCVPGVETPLLFAFSRDISARKAADKARQESEERYRAVVEFQSELIVRYRPDGTLTFVNAVGCRMSGRSAAELVGRRWQTLLHPADQQPLVQADGLPMIEARLRELTLDNPLEVFDVRFRMDDGQLGWMQFSNRAFFDDAGKVAEIQSVGRDITEHKQATDRLRYSEALLSFSQQIGHVGSWILDLPSNHLTWSAEVYRIFGLEPQAFAATYEAFLEAVHPDDRSAVDLAYGHSLREGRDSYEIEHRIIRRDTKEIRHIHERCIHERDAAGSILRSVGMVQDVSERKMAEFALREARTFKQSILDAIISQVAVLDRQGNIIEVNEAWRRFAKDNDRLASQFHCDVDMGANYLDICRVATGYSAEGAKEAALGIQSVLKGEAPLFQQEYPCHAPQARRWFLMVVTPLNREEGGAVVSHHDISSPRLLAEELSHSEARTRSILRSAPLGIGMLVDRVFVEVNETLTLMTGYAAEELIGHSARMLYPTDEDFESVGKNKYRQIRETGIGRVETRFRTKDGGIIDVALSSAPVVPNDWSRGISFTAQDITALRQAEKQRLAQEASLRNALVREVHHRIKNHLQGILGLLSSAITSHPEMAGAMESIVIQVRAIAQAYGLQGSRADTTVRACDLVQAAIDGNYSSVPVDYQQLSKDMEAILPSEEVVPMALVINELIMNAIKHLRSSDIERSVKARLAIEDGRVRVIVTNAPASLPQGFDLEKGVGTGTGLELVKTLLPRNGATLRLRQEGFAVVTELILEPPAVTCRKIQVPRTLGSIGSVASG